MTNTNRRKYNGDDADDTDDDVDIVDGDDSGEQLLEHGTLFKSSQVIAATLPQHHNKGEIQDEYQQRWWLEY